MFQTVGCINLLHEVMALLNVLVLCIIYLVVSVISDQHCKPKIISISARCFDRQKVCEEIKPCENGGTCTPTDGEERYKCDCVLGFGGVNCEKFLTKLKVESITERGAVLLVTTSNNAVWAAYLIKLTNRKTMRSKNIWSSAQPGSVTSVILSSLLPDTLYKIRVKPTQTFDQLEEWTNEISFKTPATHPVFTKVPKKTVFFNPGENAIIVCNASGVPKPKIEWKKSLLALTEGRSEQQDGRLSISNAQINDSGKYTCEASNKAGVIRTTTELVSRAVCSSLALGMEDKRIKDSKISASSTGMWLNFKTFRPSYARLHGPLSWVCTLLDYNPWLQIELPSPVKLVTRIATQGNSDHDWWITSYTLKISLDGVWWSEKMAGDITEMILGNTDSTSVATHDFLPPFKAKVIRILPVTKAGRTALRVEVYGCDVIE